MRNHSTHKRGFTLLEILAVVVILGLLGSGVTLAFVEPLNRVKESEFRDRIVAIQNQVRQRARIFGRKARIRFSSNEVEVNDGKRKRVYPLGASCRIDAIRTPKGQFFSGREFSIDYHGVSESFALNIQPKKSASYWLFVVGGSGEVIEIETESEVRQLLADYEQI